MKPFFRHKRYTVPFVLSLLFLLALGVTAGVVGVKHAEASISWEDGMSVDLGYVINGSYFTHDGYGYQNYQNAYTKRNISDNSIRTYFGRNISLQNGVLTIEVVDLTERVTGRGLTYLPGDFQSGYTLPLNSDPGEIRQAFIDKYRQTVASGFAMGTTCSGIMTWQGLLVQQFCFTDSTAQIVGTRPFGFTVMVYNPVLNRCFLYKDGFLRHYAQYSGFHFLGAPVGDSFTVTLKSNGKQTVVQNFANGYLSIAPNAAIPTPADRREYYNISLDGYEYLITNGNGYGNTGTVDAKYNGANDADRTELGNIFLKRYNKEKEKGYNPGIPRNFVTGVNGVLLQFYQRESAAFSNGKSAYQLHVIAFYAVNYPNICLIAYNPALETAFLLKNEIMTEYVKEFAELGRISENINKLGAPAGEEFAFGGSRYQNFERGYIRVTGTTAAVVEGKHFYTAETAIQSVAYDGYIGDTAIIPNGKTAGWLSNAFSQRLAEAGEAYPGIAPVGPVKSVWANNVKTTLQTLETADGKQMALCLDTVNHAVHLLDTDFFAAFQENVILGCARGEAVRDNGVTLQIFTNGYIKQADGERPFVKLGVRYEPIIDDFLPIDYSAQVGFIGSLPNRHPVKNASSQYKADEYEQEDVTDAILTAYQALIQSGFNPGVPSVEGVNWLVTGRYGLVAQMFYGGDGGGNYTGNAAYKGVGNMLAFDPSLRKAYLITGPILSDFTAGLPMIVGRPTENQVTASDGLVFQNFFGPMGDFYFCIEDGKAIYYQGAFFLNEYEASLTDGTDESERGGSEQDKTRKKRIIILSIVIPSVLALAAGGAVVVRKVKRNRRGNA